MNILVLAEHDNQAIKPATLSTVSAAVAIAKTMAEAPEVHILVVGESCQGAAEAAAKISAVSKVLVSDGAAGGHGLAENIAPLVAEVAKEYSHLLAPHTTYGKNILPRAAAFLDSQQLSDVSSIEGFDTFKRPIYAGSALATVKSFEAIKVLSVRITAFEAATLDGNAKIEAIEAPAESELSGFVGQELTQSARPELTSARVVISGGRGLGSAENFPLLETIADKLGGAVGASRAAVDAGFAPNDYQVGQTGKVVAPDLYIAVGISGAIQHLAGMKDSKVIVAINKDEDAPIFQIADYGLVADLFDVLPEFSTMLDSRKK